MILQKASQWKSNVWAVDKTWTVGQSNWCHNIVNNGEKTHTQHNMVQQRVTFSESESESEWALLARYVYTYEEFVIVTKLHSATEWQQRDRTQTTKEQYTNIQIGNVQNSKNTMQYRQSCVYRSDVQIWNGKKLNKKYYICMCGE